MPNIDTYRSFAIEGVPLAGKSTILTKAQASYPDRFNIILDSSEYIRGNENNTSFPFTTWKDAARDIREVVAVERTRTRDAQRLYDANGLPILIDRMTPVFTLFLYDYLSRAYPKQMRFYESVYSTAKKVFQEEADSGHMMIPDYTILIRPANRKVFEERRGRGVSNSVFADWEKGEFFRIREEQFLEHHYPQSEGRSLVLDSYNDDAQLRTNAGLIVSFVGMKLEENDPKPVTVYSEFLNHTVPAGSEEMRELTQEYPHATAPRIRSLLRQGRLIGRGGQ